MDDDSIKKQDTPFTDFLTSIRVHCILFMFFSFFIALNVKIGFWSGQFKEKLRYISDVQIIQELKQELQVLLDINQASSKVDHSFDTNSSIRYTKSVNYSFSMSMSSEESKSPIDFIYKCAALISLQRETIDPIIVRFICWLPGLLLQYFMIQSEYHS